ncbi:hypothetical protein EV196_11072 [Mariniflexile fucanivorans]|uniref:N-acetyltransferase domain-containing protein n=1 Tax=Mariniflexile fucanivorans TaxID=264023 RepID=A0A4R1RBP5_9FLAO|nr:hypothetical protein [Mariniflexile fucanivorans]TCL63119.1 hypothetical protein EV196_11072 [Mariniflexile fucanivorans]
MIINDVIKKIVFIENSLKKGDYLFVWNGIKKRIKSENIAFGLKRDLSEETIPPRSLISLSIRPYQISDGKYFLLDKNNYGLIEKNISTCYVAITNDGEPCFRQWLIDSSQNPKIYKFWGDSFPMLKNDEALLENAYTIPKNRGFGIMATATHLISEKGKEQGVKHIITFVDKKNVSALRSIVYSGYKPYTLRKEKWFLFIKKVSFEEIPDELAIFLNKFVFMKNTGSLVSNNAINPYKSRQKVSG